MNFFMRTHLDVKYFTSHTKCLSKANKPQFCFKPFLTMYKFSAKTGLIDALAEKGWEGGTHSF